MISASLLKNFYPVISYRRVQKESDDLLCTVWSLVMVRNQLPAQPGRKFFCPKIAIFSVLSIFKYNPGKTNDKHITSQ